MVLLYDSEVVYNKDPFVIEKRVRKNFNKTYYVLFYAPMRCRLYIGPELSVAMSVMESILDESIVDKRREYLKESLEDFKKWSDNVIKKSEEHIEKDLETVKRKVAAIKRGDDNIVPEILDNPADIETLWNLDCPWQRLD